MGPPRASLLRAVEAHAAAARAAAHAADMVERGKEHAREQAAYQAARKRRREERSLLKLQAAEGPEECAKQGRWATELKKLQIDTEQDYTVQGKRNAD